MTVLGKMGGIVALSVIIINSPIRAGYDPRDYQNVGPRHPTTPEELESLRAEMAEAKRQREAFKPGFFESLGHAATVEWSWCFKGITAHFMFTDEDYDPNWKLDKSNLDEFLGDIPVHLHNPILAAGSEAEAKYWRKVMSDVALSERKLASLGWQGSALRLGANVYTLLTIIVFMVAWVVVKRALSKKKPKKKPERRAETMSETQEQMPEKSSSATWTPKWMTISLQVFDAILMIALWIIFSDKYDSIRYSDGFYPVLFLSLIQTARVLWNFIGLAVKYQKSMSEAKK